MKPGSIMNWKLPFILIHGNLYMGFDKKYTLALGARSNMREASSYMLISSIFCECERSEP